MLAQLRDKPGGADLPLVERRRVAAAVRRRVVHRRVRPVGPAPDPRLGGRARRADPDRRTRRRRSPIEPGGVSGVYRDLFERFREILGDVVMPPGMAPLDRDARLDDAMRGRGWACARTEQVVYDRTHTLREYFEGLPRREMSWTWRVPEPDLEEATAQVRAWAESRARPRRGAAGAPDDLARVPPERRVTRVGLVRPSGRVLRRDPWAAARGGPGRERDARRRARRARARPRGRRRDRHRSRSRSTRRGWTSTGWTSPARCSMSCSARRAGRRRSRSWWATRPATPFPDGAFGAAYLRWVLHLVRDWRAVVGEVARVVAPGGVIVAHLGDYGDGPDGSDPRAIRRPRRGRPASHRPGLGVRTTSSTWRWPRSARRAGSCRRSPRPRRGLSRSSCVGSRTTTSRGRGRSTTGFGGRRPPRRGPGRWPSSGRWATSPARTSTCAGGPTTCRP